MKFIYIGRCAEGQVIFEGATDRVVMPINEPVDVPEWLARKLEKNPNCRKVNESAPLPAVSQAAPQSEPPEEDLDDEGDGEDGATGENGEPVKRKRGRPPKARTE